MEVSQPPLSRVFDYLKFYLFGIVGWVILDVYFYALICNRELQITMAAAMIERHECHSMAESYLERDKRKYIVAGCHLFIRS